MADKFGANTISSISPDPKTTYPIVLGRSFFVDQNRHRPTGFVAATYRFKPSSVDQSKPGNISFDKTRATLQFERRTNINTNTNSKKQKIKFQGESKLASDREFFLWFDASSQKMVLERSGIQIKQLKHDREQNRPISNSYNDKSKDRMKLMVKKHKVLARQKNKSLKNNNKKKTTKILKPKPSNNNNNNSDTSSTRSSSQSISPYHPISNNNVNNIVNNNVNNNHMPSAQIRNNNNNSFHRNNNNMNENTNNRNNNIKNNNGNIMNNNNNNGPKPLFGGMSWEDDSEDDDEPF